ncbi:MAG TPA: beta-ketoacyl synthase N-terminal-like domain-containing protein [Polyangia bacterium]|nr:beta-ketoacyl synthase N-terminal-like domain-containing protein [Polyangia bacterium]
MEVVVTGIGPLLPNCADRGALWTHLREGLSQLTFEAAPGEGGAQWSAGRLGELEPARWLDRFPRKFYERYSREQLIYLVSLVIALADAGLDLEGEPRERLALFDGTSRGNFDFWYDRVREEQARPARELYTRRELMLGTPGQAANLAAALFRIRGPVYTFSGTCCSGAMALGQAYRELSSGGDVEVALASGHDSCRATPLYHMYREAGLVSDERHDARRAVRPYADDADVHGNAFGEGAITLVLETRAHAERRGANILATIVGFQCGNNGAHPTDVDKEGTRATALMHRVLQKSGVDQEQIGFVVGHGNGVVQSDRSEVAYLQRVFAARTPEVPLLSTKPLYGHLLGASSTLNVAAAVLMLHHRWVVPTANVDPERAMGPVDHRAGGGRPCHAPAGMAVSYGIGGHNTVTLVERVEAAA